MTLANGGRIILRAEIRSSSDLVIAYGVALTATSIAQMRRDERLAHTPIVAISVGGRDAREAMQAAGADVFLDKPVVFNDLFNTLRMLAEHRPTSAGA